MEIYRHIIFITKHMVERYAYRTGIFPSGNKTHTNNFYAYVGVIIFTQFWRNCPSTSGLSGMFLLVFE